MNFNKFTIKSQEALQNAQAIASSYNNQLIEPEHLLAALVQDSEGIVIPLLQKLGANVNYLKIKINETIERLPKVQGAGLGNQQLSQSLGQLFENAQKEAALSYGARGGLAHRNYEIMQRMHGFEATLDKVFNFRLLLVNTPSGLLIEPPIVRESLDSMVITQGGNEAAVADRILDINKQAKIVSAPRVEMVFSKGLSARGKGSLMMGMPMRKVVPLPGLLSTRMCPPDCLMMP